MSEIIKQWSELTDSIKSLVENSLLSSVVSEASNASDPECLSGASLFESQVCEAQKTCRQQTSALRSEILIKLQEYYDGLQEIYENLHELLEGSEIQQSFELHFYLTQHLLKHPSQLSSFADFFVLGYTNQALSLWQSALGRLCLLPQKEAPHISPLSYKSL